MRHKQTFTLHPTCDIPYTSRPRLFEFESHSMGVKLPTRAQRQSTEARSRSIVRCKLNKLG